MNNNQTQSTNQSKPNRFHLKTWQWVSVLVLVVMIAGGIFVVLNRGVQISPRDEHQQRITEKNKINQAIKDANYCDTSNDCVLLGEYCPFSNSWETYVNKQEKEKIQSMIEDFNKNTNFISACEPRVCNNISPVQCVEGKCYVECQDYGEVAIITDKTEYQREENIKITVINNSNEIICYDPEKDCGLPFWTLSQYQENCSRENCWQEVRQVPPCVSTEIPIRRQLKIKEKIEENWNQTIFAAEPSMLIESPIRRVDTGKYRFEFEYWTYSPGCPRPMGVTPTALSNEFEIKEKVSLLTNKTANWGNYRNEKYGYELKYPQDWITEEIDSAVYFWRNLSNDAQASRELGAPLSISVQETEFKTVLEWFENNISYIVPDKTAINIDEIQGLRYSDTTSIGGCNENFIFLNDPYLYKISRHGSTCDYSDETFDQILASLKFIENDFIDTQNSLNNPLLEPQTTVCSQLDSTAEQELCYLDLAKKTYNTQLCNKMPNLAHTCYFEIAKSQLDENICNLISKGEYISSPWEARDLCFKEIATLKKEAGICKYIISAWQKQKCNETIELQNPPIPH